ncbi:MAG TPA: response regulator [Gemmatimonadales bacterium]|nr:response regulator [Gemmatimonadales bacterium]
MGNLVLVIQHAVDARRGWRRRLESRGYEAVEASSVVAGLELLQRLPKAFRLVLVCADMPGLPGAALVETLRLLRPELPVFYLGASDAGVEVGCPSVSESGEELEMHLQAFAGTAWGETSRLSPEAVSRVRDRYGRRRDLVEAAYEVARELPAG